MVPLQVPVYFAYENEVLTEILKELKANDEVGVLASATSGGYRFVVKTPEGKKQPAPTLVNIQVRVGSKSTGHKLIVGGLILVTRRSYWSGTGKAQACERAAFV
jgi:hypothetical protein